MCASSGAKTNIAVVIGQLEMGGSERQLHAFLEHYDRDRWNPIVYVSGSRGPWDDPIRDLGIPVKLLHGSPVMKMWRFRKSCRVNGVRRFFSWSAYTNGYGLALSGLHIPCIGSFRNIYPLESSIGNGWFRSWMSLAAVSTIVCNSEETASTLRRQVGKRKRVVYVPNSVEAIEDLKSRRKAWRNRLGISKAEVLILGVGRLTSQKNFARFIAAVALVNQEMPIRAIVAGRDDGLLESLRQGAEAYALGPDVIEFVGPVVDARELMCAADVFVLSSDYEGMPNVIMEAMAAGVPCVCTSVNGVGNLIEQGVSGFISAHRAEDLAEKILPLVRDRKLRQKVGARAVERMKGSFDPGKIAAHLWELCE